MKLKSLFLVGAASIALLSCGKDNASSSDGTSISRSNLAAAASSKTSPFDKKYSLKKASAFDVDGFLTTMGYEGEKPYGSVKFDEKLGATIITDIKADDGKGSIVTIAKAELFGVDEEAFGRVKNGVASIDSPFETLFQKVRLYDVSLVPNQTNLDADDKFDLRLGGLEFDQLKIRQGGVDTSAGEDTMAAQAFNLFDLGGLFIKDLNMDFSSDEVGSLKLSAPDMRIVGFGGGKLNSIVANDLDYTFSQSPEALSKTLAGLGPQVETLFNGPLGVAMGLNGQRVKLKSMLWNGIDASGLLEYGLKGEVPPTSARDLISLGRGEYKDMETYLGDKLLATTKITTFEMDQFTWLVPNVIKSDTKGGVYNFSAYIPDGEEFDQYRSILTKNGLDSVKADSTALWNWDDKKGSASLTTDFNTDKFADFSMSMNMGKLVFDEIATMVEEENQAGLISVGDFKNFSLKIKDKALLDTVFDIAAIQMGAGTGADLRGSAPAMVRLGGGQVASINPLFADYIDAVANFLGEGGTLEISANPEEAVSFFELGAAGQTAPETLPNLLNMTVTHSK